MRPTASGADDELAPACPFMESVQQAADTHSSVELTTTCERLAAAL